jgi:hypothetical protein
VLEAAMSAVQVVSQEHFFKIKKPIFFSGNVKEGAWCR